MKRVREKAQLNSAVPLKTDFLVYGILFATVFLLLKRVVEADVSDRL